MFQYLPFVEKWCTDDIGTYTTFGIKVLDSDNSEVLSVSDVSVDRAFVVDLCRKFTDTQLDPVHLLDVIEDSL